jgi:hypothetical protein
MIGNRTAQRHQNIVKYPNILREYEMKPPVTSNNADERPGYQLVSGWSDRCRPISAICQKCSEWCPNRVKQGQPELDHISVSFVNGILEAGMQSGDGGRHIYSATPSPIHTDIDLVQTDNNNGMTVINITDPESPTYCFVSVTGTESKKELPQCMPLSTEDYLCAYYPLPTPSEMEETQTQADEKYTLDTIATLEGTKMVTLEVLASAWPDEYKRTLKTSLEKSPPGAPEPMPVTTTIPSLSDLTVLPSVKAALEKGDTTKLEEILWIPEKMTQIQSMLREIKPFPDSGISLLTEIIAHQMKSDDAAINLSGYALSGTQIIQIASSSNDKMRTLNLSYNKDITVDTVCQILTSFPLLKRLVLLGCMSITDDDIKEILTSDPKLFYNLEALIHPFLLKDKAFYPNAFSYIGIMSDYGKISSCSLAYFSPPAIVQALTDLLPCVTSEDARFSGIMTSGLAAQSTFCAALRDEHSHGLQQKW